jgi:hypothetical protein
LQGNTPSDHFKRLEKFAAAASSRNLLQRSLLSSALLQAILPAPSQADDGIATTNINTNINRKMLHLQEQQV